MKSNLHKFHSNDDQIDSVKSLLKMNSLIENPKYKRKQYRL